jgi:hypothetical protein
MAGRREEPKRRRPSPTRSETTEHLLLKQIETGVEER